MPRVLLRGHKTDMLASEQGTHTHTHTLGEALVVTRQPGGGSSSALPGSVRRQNPTISTKAHIQVGRSSWTPLLKSKHDGFALTAKKERSEHSISQFLV